MNSGGSWGNGNISSSNRSILPRILMRPYLALKDAQFCGPVGQRQEQPLQIRIAGADLPFDGRDLAPAAFHSRGDRNPLGFDLLKSSTVAVEHSLLPGVFLIPAHYAVGVLR